MSDLETIDQNSGNLSAMAKMALENENKVIIVDDQIDEDIKSGLISRNEASEMAKSFLSNYFSEAHKVIHHEETFEIEIGHIDVKIDYVKCRRFLTTAINNLKDIDFDLMKGTLLKIYKDAESLFTYYAKFHQDIKNWVNIFELQFVKKIKPIQNVLLEMRVCKITRDSYNEKLRASDEDIKRLEQMPQTSQIAADLRELKNNHGELVHNYATARDRFNELNEIYNDTKDLLKIYFEAAFRAYSGEVDTRLSKAVNFKAYCLDKLLWYEAENNPHINAFFKRANISDDYSMQTFITFYLKRIDMNKSKDNEWHIYLQELVDMLKDK